MPGPGDAVPPVTDVTMWITSGWFTRCIACRRLLLVPGMTSGHDNHPGVRRPICSPCAKRPGA